MNGGAVWTSISGTRQGTLLGSVTSVLDLGSWVTNHERGHFAHIRHLCNSLGT
jgi:hypothetical protein